MISRWGHCFLQMEHLQTVFSQRSNQSILYHLFLHIILTAKSVSSKTRVGNHPATCSRLTSLSATDECGKRVAAIQRGRTRYGCETIVLMVWRPHSTSEENREWDQYPWHSPCCHMGCGRVIISSGIMSPYCGRKVLYLPDLNLRFHAPAMAFIA